LMSRIRFLHTDHLRLGAALTGLADCPEWLRRTASSAVRKSVSNLCELAIAERCQFVLIAGEIAEHPEDFGAACAWLSGLTVELQRHGIRIVLAAQTAATTRFQGQLDSERLSASHATAIQSLNPVYCGVAERIEVWLDYQNQIQFAVLAPAAPRQHRDSVVLEMGSMGTAVPRSATELTYISVPGVCGAADSVLASRERLLAVTAGSPQAVCPEERGAFGCRIVDVDTQQQCLTARFCPTDEVRYAREVLPCASGMTSFGLRAAMGERCRAYSSKSGQTVVLDWVVEGQLQAGPEHPGLWDEAILLRELRAQQDGGHAGVWARRVHFSSSSVFLADSRTGLAVHEFLNLVAHRNSKSQFLTPVTAQPGISAADRNGNDTVAGLNFLLRAA
jgi:hypothetical protein